MAATVCTSIRNCSWTRRSMTSSVLGEYAAALRVEVRAGREHAGDEQMLRCPDPRDVRVLAERLAQRIHVVDLDIGHQRFLRSWRHCTSRRPAWRLSLRPAMKSTSDRRLR